MKKLLLYTLFLTNLFIILFFWWNSSNTLISLQIDNLLLALGRLTGLLAVYFVLLQFIFMGRTRWIEEIFGLDKLSRIHHWNGYVSISLILTHPTLLTISYAITNKINLLAQFLDFLSTYDDVLKAFLAVLIFSAIIFFSIYIVRKHLKYEYWYFIHLATYIAVLLAWGHQLALGGDFSTSQLFVWYWYALYIFVFANLLWFRILRQTFLFTKHKFAIEKIIPETNQTTSIYITGQKLEKFKSKPGQFLSLRFLNKFWWQQHPFSLSSIPQSKHLRITIKNSGDFTAKVKHFKPGTPILLDGPFGTFTLEQSQSHKLLFIAGGIGITPIRTLLEKAAAQGKDIILLYSNKTQSDITFKKELDDLAKKYKFPIHYILTADKTYKGETGRIDKTKITKLVKDLTQREIFLCGPVNMIAFVEKELNALGVSNSQIHYEKFSLQ